MTIESAGMCRNGHDLAVLGRYQTGSNIRKCVACYRAKRRRTAHTDAGRARKRAYFNRRYSKTEFRLQNNAKGRAYRATIPGQIAIAKGQLKARINYKIARIDELERELQSYA